MVGVRVLGAGPAGSAAALAALELGAQVEIFEKTPFPRHKVCGEFLSPECVRVLGELGVWDKLADVRPAGLTRLVLHFGDRVSESRLPEPAWGLSRYALDQTLLDAAVSRGAVLHREKGKERSDIPTVVATGRHSTEPRGRRLFGFKAHFDGQSNDAVELYFLKGLSYVGMNAAEGGITNICGLAREEKLARTGFDIDAFLAEQPVLQRRMAGMRRKWKWLIVGPLHFDDRVKPCRSSSTYYAGDCLAFPDPFTGSGILSALVIGRLAGRAASELQSISDYNVTCRTVLNRQLGISGVFRRSLAAGWGYRIAGLIPSSWLFQMTRPRVASGISG